MSRNVLFNKRWMWKFSSNHVPSGGGAGAFCSSDITRNAKNTSHAPSVKRIGNTWVTSILDICQTKRHVTLEHVDCLTPFPLDNHPSCSKKCHSPCPLAPVPAILANRPQRLSSPFNHRSHCFLSVSVVVVPGQAFYMLFLDYWKLEVLLPLQYQIYGWGDNSSLPGDNLASLCQC